MSGPGTQQLRPVWKSPLLITNLLVAHNLPGMLIFESTSHPLVVLLLQVGRFLPIHCCCCSARWRSGTKYAYTLFWLLSTIRPAGGWDTSWALLYSVKPELLGYPRCLRGCCCCSHPGLRLDPVAASRLVSHCSSESVAFCQCCVRLLGWGECFFSCRPWDPCIAPCILYVGQLYLASGWILAHTSTCPSLIASMHQTYSVSS